jgi:streptogramin lyase
LRATVPVPSRPTSRPGVLSRRPALPLLLALAAVCAGATLPAAAAELRVAETDSLAPPVVPDPGRVRITGLTWAGEDTLALLVAEVDSLALEAPECVFLVVGDTTGTVFWQEDFTGVLARGLTWDGEFFWSTGDDAEGGSLLYKIKADTVGIEEVHPAPGHRPMAMAFDGRWIWVSDRDRGTIDRVDPETGAVTRTAYPPGFSPVGLAWDGQAMWSTDAGTGRLGRLRGGRLDRQALVAADDWYLRDADALLAHDGRSLWVLRPDDRFLRRLERD